ncbi:Kunitz inhibitor ST1-like [Vigna unguiculata]|uniref:Kunitz inhibitor ST1-like n=1 Tax=Vigna unguiculata TaxID=3917 RepID=A0A4D6LUA5_VIGUN|nr:Kunitz inhibitor ST1-like [Vigna unguiculata]
MKNTVLAFVLLFALSLQVPLLRATDAPAEAVVDMSGKKLQVGESYFIVPAMRTFTRCGKFECLNAEGLSLANIGESCPLDVVVVQRSLGLPLSFSPLDANEGVVLESTDLNIIFSTDRTSCDEYSLVWKLNHFGGSKSGFVCLSSKHLCEDVGVFVDENGNRRLALSDVPFKVKFHLAKSN